MKNLNIGILLLTFNSEKYILNCLNSIKNIASQIVIVDTGSVDNTINICKKFPVEIYFKKFNNDFSEQRNFALSHLRTDWILMIDSDEELTYFDCDEFIRIAKNPILGGINFIIKNLLNNGSEQTTHRYTRLFRNNKLFKFRFKIHEQIRESIEENGYQIINTNFEITHYGYNTIDENKLKRNIELLESEINENDDDFMKYHLANTLFAKKEYNIAEKIYREIIQKEHLDISQLENAKIRIAQILFSDSKYDEAYNFLNFHSDDENIEGFRLFMLGSIFIYRKEYQKANEILKNDIIKSSNMVNKELLKNAIDLLNKLLSSKL